MEVLRGMGGGKRIHRRPGRKTKGNGDLAECPGVSRLLRGKNGINLRLLHRTRLHQIIAYSFRHAVVPGKQYRPDRPWRQGSIPMQNPAVTFRATGCFYCVSS